MASLFTGLNTARSGLMASQTALDITAQNISNANTPGYTRQMLNLTSVGPNTGGYRLMYNIDRVGNGVNYSGVTQSRDSFLDVRYRNANSEYSGWQGQSDALKSIEDIFNEFSGSKTDVSSGLSGQMTGLLNNLQEYQNTPTDTTLPAVIKSSVDTIAFTVRNDYSSLTDFKSQQMSDLAATVNGNNTGGGIVSQLGSIADLNKQIASYEITGQKANDLRDQRNVLLDQLSGELNINVTEQKNGMVTVGIASDNTHMLISDDNTVTGLKLNDTQDAVEWDVAGNPAAKVSGGTVDAYLQVINGDGSGTGTYGSQGIVYLKNKLNDFAVNFDQLINKFAAEDKALPPANPDTASTALVNYNPAGDAAATIDLSAGWKSDPSLFAENYTGSSIGNYVGELIGKLNDSGTVTLNTGNDVPGPVFSGSILDFADSFTGDIATTVNHASSMASSTGSIVDNLDSQRKAISSVSTDEEGINIVKFQQSYNASARVITAINDMLDTLINSMAV